MTRPRSLLVFPILALACVSLPAQVVTTGAISIGGGGALLDGDRPALQQRLRHRKDGFGGIEDFSWSRTSDSSLWRFELRAIPGDEDYRVGFRHERFDAFYVEADYRQFRVFYDGSGGRLLPRDLAISYFDEALALDRSFFSVEIGTLAPERPLWRLRYERNTRDGIKNSIRWGDSNLAGQPFVPRAFIPSYLVVDETRDSVVAEASRRTDDANWRIAGRYERTRVDNRHTARRRALEPQDRYVTMRESTTTELLSGHGHYERVFHEKLRGAAGGMVTSIDTNLGGGKIYGATPDAEYSPTFARRQAGDVGYFGLAGNTRLKQYVANANLVYQPDKHWTLLPAVRYEHLRQDSGEGHFDTDFPGGAAVQRQIEAANRNSWNEAIGELEVRHARWAGVSLGARAILNRGTGNLVEQSFLLPARGSVIDRETHYERSGQKYVVSATWLVRPGLTLAAQYAFRRKLADYDSTRDSTSNAAASRDRYPAYIIDQDLAAHEGSLRLSWRPMSSLAFLTRYARQISTVTSTMAGLTRIENGRHSRHVVTQTATWTATPRLHFAGAVTVTCDQLAVPAHRLTFNSDNNYTSASLSSGYAIGKVTDLFLDAGFHRADNYTDNPAVTLPLNAGQSYRSAFLTWVRRQSERVVYTLRYGYAENRDGTYGGQNDFTAHLFYGKVQYKF